ncbi:MAG: hypothetical protein KDA72_01995 [Planctomycetales bacterium]|nr:hypothetical protein [Planctomycetales bacterium]
MADQADVRSLDRLEEFRQQAEAFRTGLLKEIESLTLELRRLTQWLEQDVLGYWGDESSKAERRWAECRDNLSRCQSYVRVDEKRPCTEEKKRLRLAEQRLELCQQKLRLSQAALTFWQTERSKLQAHIARCQDFAESNMRVTCEHLRDQIERLSLYTQLRSTPRSTPPSSPPNPGSPHPGTPGRGAEAEGQSEQRNEP